MQVTVENVSELSRRMTVTVEDANIAETVLKRLNEIRPTIKQSGFRPGKVPMKMLEKSHGPSIRRDIIDELVKSSMQEAFTQEKVSPASPPNIEKMDENEASFSYSMVYDVFPDIKKVNLKNISVVRTFAEVKDADVDVMLQTLREQRMVWEPLKRGAKEKDGVTIDFVGRIDGEEFDGGKGSDTLVVIGDGTMLPEFDNQLIGKKAGQEIAITLTFPDDYRVEHLQGKLAIFSVTIKSVAKKKLPKLDKEFAKLCGVDGGLTALKKEVRGNMTRELANSLKSQNKRVVMDSIVALNEITLPEGPVEREAEFLMEQAKKNLINQGVSVDKVPFELDNFKDSAKTRVSLSLLIGKIISDNNITAEESKVKEVIDSIAASYEDPEDVVKFYMNDQQKLSEIQMMVVEDSVVEWVYDKVKVEDRESSFSDVMNAASA